MMYENLGVNIFECCNRATNAILETILNLNIDDAAKIILLDRVNGININLTTSGGSGYNKSNGELEYINIDLAETISKVNFYFDMTDIKAYRIPFLLKNYLTGVLAHELGHLIDYALLFKADCKEPLYTSISVGQHFPLNYPYKFEFDA